MAAAAELPRIDWERSQLPEQSNHRNAAALFDPPRQHAKNTDDMNESHTMQCMEVWGGNQPVDCGVVMAGLDAWVYSRPYGNAAAGGDVHYVSSCATGRITRLLLADVSGHGDTVSAAAVNLRNLMRKFINFIDQTRFVRNMNEQFGMLAGGGQFATAIVTTYFASTNELAICNAGHPPPFVYRTSNKTWSVLEPGNKTETRKSKNVGEPVVASGISNTPLGIIDLARYDQFATRMAVGDMILCYTDCLIECRDAGGGLLGVEGLYKIVQSIDASEPAQLVTALLAALRALNPSNLLEDDITALLFRVNGLAPRLTLREKARSLKLWLGSVVRALKPGGGPVPWPEISLPNLGGAMVDKLGRAGHSKGEDIERGSG
ncbi:MAG: serine/threonine-protein phosphatase [Planctomycetes bacterium]|nr:serine/threonine-protein phosphatase [Planctomycetota bacterium]